MDIPDAVLEKDGADSFVMFGSSDIADMRYITGFTTTDQIAYIRKRGERGVIIVSQMELSRALLESTCSVMTRAEAGLLDILKTEKDRWKALAAMIAGLSGSAVLVPAWFPIILARELERYGSVIVDRGTIEGMKAKKTHREIEYIKKVQAVTESAMDRAITLIRNSKARDGVLYQDNSPLTSENVRAAIHFTLLESGCIPSDTIVSCGNESGMPHARGSGPLREDEPIVIDIFPRDEHTGYYSDMSRTVCKGEPSREIIEMYSAVLEAQDLASHTIRAGVTGADVYQAVVDLFSEKGYPTGNTGFVHNLGHGVGLDVHELPSVGPGGGELSVGNIITNEPGLYFPDLGGIRLEDIGAVTRTGFDCFTHFPKELIL
ncbi:MAG: peptidase M24 [Methanolinea sp. SDB]|nr:MAG: peptidase M24 [Methanolinea sp. SDB]